LGADPRKGESKKGATWSKIYRLTGTATRNRAKGQKGREGPYKAIMKSLKDLLLCQRYQAKSILCARGEKLNKTGIERAKRERIIHDGRILTSIRKTGVPERERATNQGATTQPRGGRARKHVLGTQKETITERHGTRETHLRTR